MYELKPGFQRAKLNEHVLDCLRLEALRHALQGDYYTVAFKVK